MEYYDHAMLGATVALASGTQRHYGWAIVGMAALAAALDSGDDVESALRRFEGERAPENNRIIERARHLGAYLQATHSAEERARSVRHGIPEAVLAETALLDFLYERPSAKAGQSPAPTA